MRITPSLPQNSVCIRTAGSYARDGEIVKLLLGAEEKVDLKGQSEPQMNTDDTDSEALSLIRLISVLSVA